MGKVALPAHVHRVRTALGLRRLKEPKHEEATQKARSQVPGRHVLSVLSDMLPLFLLLTPPWRCGQRAAAHHPGARGARSAPPALQIANELLPPRAEVVALLGGSAPCAAS